MIPQSKFPLDMSGPALRAFAGISKDWILTEQEQRALLGGPTPPTLREWLRAARMRERVRVPDGVLIRIQLLLQIRCGIKRPMPDPVDQGMWLRARNRDLAGRTPLSAMLSGSHEMAEVRDLVDSWSAK